MTPKTNSKGLFALLRRKKSTLTKPSNNAPRISKPSSNYRSGAMKYNTGGYANNNPEVGMTQEEYERMMLELQSRD